MKTPLIRRLSIALISAVLSLAAPVFGEGTTDMLSKALDLVHQVANPTGNPPSDAQRIELLTKAIGLAQQAPNHRLKGHRVWAIQDIRAALAEIRKGDPDHKAADSLRDAESELSASVSLATNVAVTQPAVVATPATPPPLSPLPSSADSSATPIDIGAVKEVVTRLLANASKKPPGPVEKDVTDEFVKTFAASMKMQTDADPHEKAPSLRDSIAASFNDFSLEGELRPLYSEGRAAIVYCKVKLTDDALAEQKEDTETSTVTDANGKSTAAEDGGAMFGEGGGFSCFVGPKIKTAHIIATFCLVQQHGQWKVHCHYFSNDVIEGGNKDFIIRELSTFGNGAAPKPAVPAKRRVVIHFDLQKNAPPPTGSIRVSYSDKQRKTDTVKIENGEAQFEVPVPNQIDLDPDGLVGCSFEVRQGISITQGLEPERIAVRASPAGAIYCDLTEADGSPARDVFFTTEETKKPQEGKSHHFAMKGHLGGDGLRHIIAAPLSFGSDYAIVVWRDNTFAISPSCHIDEKTTIENVKVVIPEGKTIRFRCLDLEGTAARNLKFTTEYIVPWETTHFEADNLETDANGWLVISHFNTDFPGEYRLKCASRATYVPLEVTLDPRKTEQEIRVTRGKIITGIVKDAITDKPIAGMGVYALYADCGEPTRPTRPWNDWFDAEARTDSEGHFRFSNLPEGDFTLEVRSSDFDDPNEHVTTRGGQKEPVILNLKPHPKGPAPSPSPIQR